MILANAGKVSVALTATLLAEVRQAVASSAYASSSEVLRDWRAKRFNRHEELAAVKSDIEKGLADVAGGRIKDFFDVDAIARGGSY